MAMEGRSEVEGYKMRYKTTSLLFTSTAVIILLGCASLGSADNPKSSYAARRFTRPITLNGPDIAMALPESYSDLGPNVKASKSFKRLSRRTGLAYTGEDDSETTNHRDGKSTREATFNEGSATSQPDISSVISSTSNSRNTRLSERISALRKKFPNFRNRNKLRNSQSRTESSESEIRELSTSSPLDKFTSRSSDYPRETESDVYEPSFSSINVPSSTVRPHHNRERRPGSNHNRYRSTKRPASPRFRQNEKRRTPSPDFPSQRSHSRDIETTHPTSLPSRKHLARAEQTGSVDNNETPQWRNQDEELYSTRSTQREDAIAETTGAISYSNSKMFQLSSPSTGKRDEYNERGQDQWPEEIVHQKDLVDANPFEGHQNFVDQMFEKHNIDAPMRPSLSDNRQDWYPNHPHNSNHESTADISYGQYQRNDIKPNTKNPNEPKPIQITPVADNSRKYDARSQKKTHRFISTRPKAYPTNEDDQIRQNHVSSDVYKIPDLSLSSDNSPEYERNILQTIGNDRYSEDDFPSTEKNNLHGFGFPKDSSTLFENNQKERNWAFNPQWAVSIDDSRFVPSNSPTTETLLMEPTKVPGSSHLVTQKEFPYNFWKPENINIEDQGIYPKRRTQNNRKTMFKPVPQHMLTVGNGPISVPENMAKDTFEMVTAEPSFDLISNPFGIGNNAKFNSLPEVNEIVSSMRPNRRRAPQQNRNIRRPNAQRSSNPFQGIMNFINPHQNQRQNPKRPGQANLPIANTNNHPANRNTGANRFRLSTIPPFRAQLPTNSTVVRDNRHFNGHVGSNRLEYQHDNTNRKSENIQNFGAVRAENRPQVSFAPARSRPKHPASFNAWRSAGNRRPSNHVGPEIPRQHPRIRQPHPRHSDESRVQRPNWQNRLPSEPVLIKPVNPHSQYVTPRPAEFGTKSHFDVKYYTVDPSLGTQDSYADRVGSQRSDYDQDQFIIDKQDNFELSQLEEQPPRSHVPIRNQFSPQHNFNIKNSNNNQRFQRPQRRPFTALSSAPVHRQTTMQHRRRQQSSNTRQSLWSRLSEFDFSFLNPFSQSDDSVDPYGGEVDRLASAVSLPATLLVPGGLAVIGAGLGLFYFNYGWLVQTPVVKARLADMVMSGANSSLSDDQERAIGDVTKVYSILAEISEKFSNIRDPPTDNSPAEPKNVPDSPELLITQDCKNRLVCQTYHEFNDLLDVTKGAAAFLSGALKSLDQDLLLEYFLAADRGHHLKDSNYGCQDFYTSCQLPQVSIKSALRDLIGIKDSGLLEGTNELGEEGRSLGGGGTVVEVRRRLNAPLEGSSEDSNDQRR